MFIGLIILFGLLKGLPNLGIFPNLDEGIVMVDGMRILAGQLPYRDFFSFWTPGSQLISALTIKIFGTSVLAFGVISLIVQTIKVLIVSQLTKGYNWFLRLGIVAYFLNLIPIYSQYNHKLWSQLFLLCALASRKNPYLFGLFTGLTAFVTQNEGAVLLLVGIYFFRKDWVKFLAGIGTIWLPFIVYLIVSKTLPDFVQQVIIYPFTGYQEVINLGDYLRGLKDSLFTTAMGSRIIIPALLITSLYYKKNWFYLSTALLFALSTYYLGPSPFFFGLLFLSLIDNKNKILYVVSALSIIIFFGSFLNLRIEKTRPVEEFISKYSDGAYFLGSMPYEFFVHNVTPTSFLDYYYPTNYTQDWQLKRNNIGEYETIITDKDGDKFKQYLIGYSLVDEFNDNSSDHLGNVKVYQKRLGGVLDNDYPILEAIVNNLQKNYESSGKYLQISKTTRPSGLTYQVDEYVSSQGKGYQLVVSKPDGSTKSFAAGPEKDLRTWDWTTPPISSTTSTL